MRHLLAALVLVFPVIVAGCSKEEDPHKLVAEANALLVKGGIEDSKTRALAEQKYDRAIRIICGTDNLQCVRSGSGSAPGTDAHSLAHAHFGLAFARSFDLVERIRQLYESGTIMRPDAFVVEDDDLGLGGDESEQTADVSETNRCKQQVNLPQLVPLLKTIVDTSLLPIVADLQAVTNYEEFNIEYEKAFLDFGFLNPELPADEELGFEFGQLGGVNAKFTVAEVYAALAVFRVITVGAEAVFSFQDLTQAAIVFLPKIDFSAGVRPYELARVLNTDPCMANPLSDAAFGVLTEAGRNTFSDIQAQLTNLFREQSAGFATHIAKKDADRLIDYSGSAWGGNLLKRIKTGSSKDDTNLQTVGASLTSLVSPEEIGSAFDKLLASIESGDTFDLVEFVKANQDLNDLLTVQKKINLTQMGIPAISFKRFFENPISDLKSIFPLTYAESEPVSQSRTEGDDFLEMLKQDRPVGKAELTWLWKDVNGDGHFNQKGDFIVQTEREVFFDRNNNENASNLKPADLLIASGILGTFYDADYNGAPDPGFENLIPGASGLAVTFATNKLWATSATAAAEDQTFRDYYDSNVGYSNGCLDFVPVEHGTSVTGRATCELELGQVLGHVWPSIYPEPFAAVSASDGRRRDPANGVVDRMYMFYPNPSINGAFQIKGAQGYRPFANEDLNRFVSGMLTINSVVTKLTSNK